MLPKFNKNEEREKEKGGERKQRNFGNTITEIPLPKMLPVQLKKAIAATPLPKQEKKKILVIVAMALPRMGKKIEWNYGNVIAENGRKKKFCCRNLRRNF